MPVTAEHVCACPLGSVPPGPHPRVRPPAYNAHQLTLARDMTQLARHGLSVPAASESEAAAALANLKAGGSRRGGRGRGGS